MGFNFFSNRRRREVLIIDPALQGPLGHHLNANIALNGLLSGVGFDPEVLHHRNLPPDALDGAKQRPAFSAGTYDLIQQVVRSPSSYDALLKKFELELDNALKGTSSKVLVFPTVSDMELNALGAWLCDHPNPKRLTIAFWVVFEPGFLANHPRQEERAKARYKRAFEKLDKAASRGVSILPLVETEQLKKIYQPLTGTPVHVCRVPSAVYLHDAVASFKREKGAPTTIAYCGDVRHGKGFELLPGIVERTLEQSPDVRFKINVTVQHPEHFKGPLEALERLGERVDFSIGSLSILEFQEFIAQSDLVLLPYDPKIYSSRGSGVCDEAEALGVPQVVPAKVSFSAAALSRGTAVGFDEFSEKAISAAVVEAVRNLDRLRENLAITRNDVPNQNKEFQALLLRTLGHN